MPDFRNLYTALKANWHSPGRVALESPGNISYAFSQIDDFSGRLAHAIQRIGVKVGDRVAVQVEKSPEALFLYLACLRAGAVFLPLNTAYTEHELGYFLSDAEPALFVLDEAKQGSYATLVKQTGVPACLSLRSLYELSLSGLAKREQSSFDNAAAGGNDVAAILYTSGTTGRSKGAMLTHQNLVSNAAALAEAWRFTESDVLIHALPMFHTHGLFVACNLSLMAGGTMLFLPKFDVDEIFKVLPHATAMMGVPTFYTRLLDEPGLTRDATSHMRVFISGSAPLLAGTHRAFQARTGHAIVERYGMTETSINTSTPYDGERLAGSVGLPVGDVEVRIASSETGAPLECAGEIGMVEVRGSNVFKGYWRMPDKTAAEFREDGFFITGDLGRIDRNGYLHIVGRGKDLVISGGYNVYPKEIEGEIDGLRGVVESAVVGVPHPDFGEAVVAVVVADPDTLLNETAMLSALRQRLANYKVPKRIVLVPELPRNAMGKVQKAVLRTNYDAMFTDEVDITASPSS